MFLVPLAISAAVTGVTWLTAKKAIEFTSSWEGRIEVYDYEEKRKVDINKILDSPNGHIIEMKILYKNATGSLNGTFGNLIPLNHVTLLLKTNNKEYWAIEKNYKMIHIQKSFAQNDVISKLSGEIRDKPLVYNRNTEDDFLKKWKLKKDKFQPFYDNEVQIYEIFNYIYKNEIEIKFGYAETCQTFVSRILNKIFEIPFNILTIFDYISNKFKTLETFHKVHLSNNFISKINFLSRSGENYKCIGFLFTLCNEGYISIEINNGKIKIQLANDKNIVLTELFGINRGVTKISVNESLNIIYKKMTLNNIVGFIKDNTWINDEKFIEDVIKFITDFPLNDFSFYDYNINRLQNLNSFLIKADYLSLIKADYLSLIKADYLSLISAKIWFKMCQNDNDSNISVEDCMVLILTINNGDYWSAEKIDNIIYLQRSRNEEKLKTMLNGTNRRFNLEINKFSVEQFNQSIDINHLFRFIMELQMKILDKSSENFIEPLLSVLVQF